MAITTVDSNKTILNDRVMFSDGDSCVSADELLSLVTTGKSTVGLFVETITPELEQFNKLVPKAEQISTKISVTPNNYDWNIPQEYAELDVVEYVTEQLFELLGIDDTTEITNFNHDRLNRVASELVLFEKKELFPVLRVLIFVINTLREKNVVWGVGRGSSVASYVLHVIGVHDVDSVTYDLDILEFLH